MWNFALITFTSPITQYSPFLLKFSEWIYSFLNEEMNFICHQIYLCIKVWSSLNFCTRSLFKHHQKPFWIEDALLWITTATIFSGLDGLDIFVSHMTDMSHRAAILDANRQVDKPWVETGDFPCFPSLFLSGLSFSGLSFVLFFGFSWHKCFKNNATYSRDWCDFSSFLTDVTRDVTDISSGKYGINFILPSVRFPSGNILDNKNI